MFCGRTPHDTLCTTKAMSAAIFLKRHNRFPCKLHTAFLTYFLISALSSSLQAPMCDCGQALCQLGHPRTPAKDTHARTTTHNRTHTRKQHATQNARNTKTQDARNANKQSARNADDRHASTTAQQNAINTKELQMSYWDLSKHDTPLLETTSKF